jgi:hypothetical protein
MYYANENLPKNGQQTIGRAASNTSQEQNIVVSNPAMYDIKKFLNENMEMR